MKERKKGSGGKRPGSGRKKEGRRHMGFSIKLDTAEKLDGLSRHTKSGFVNEAIEEKFARTSESE